MANMDWLLSKLIKNHIKTNKNHIKTNKNQVKSIKNQLKPIKTIKSMVFSRFFQFLMKKPGFLVFSEKTEKTNNPDRKSP